MTPVSDIARTLVRSRLESYQVDSVWIRRVQRGTLDPNSGSVASLSAATTLYRGSPPGTPNARVKLVSPTGNVDLSAGPIAQRQVIVSIPWDAPIPENDDLVTVEAATDTPVLVGSTWRILGVAGGGIFAAVRELSCGSWGKSSYWSGA